MATSVTVGYGLAVVGFVVGVALWARLMNLDGVDIDRGGFKYLVIIPGFAGLSYLAMTFNIGTVTLGGETVVLPRYIDWLVTTPILVGYVGYVAGAPRKWIGAVMIADALMILTGTVATAIAPPGKWIFFTLSSLFRLSLFGVLYGVFPKYAAEHRKRRGLFHLLQNHVGLLWIAYPVIWLVGPSALGYASATAISLVVAYLDVVAKVPYIYFIWNRRSSFDIDASGTGLTTGEPAVADD